MIPRVVISSSAFCLTNSQWERKREVYVYVHGGGGGGESRR